VRSLVFGLLLTAGLAASSIGVHAGGGLYGDANCDHTVNSVDSAVVLQASAGLVSAPPCPATADVNGDQSFNSLDSVLILQFSAGLLTYLGPPRDACDDAYPTVCIPSLPPDLDCPDMPFTDFDVLPPDPHAFDTDHDGIGCESPI
jgi:hypothetical protein